MIRSLSSLRLIFGQTFWSLLFSKKTLFFLFGSFAYAAIVGVTVLNVGDRTRHDDIFSFITMMLMWQALMPLTLMFFAISAVRDEIADRTLVFLISGPVPRSAIWLGKFLAATLVATLLVAAGLAAACVAALVFGSSDSFYRVDESTLQSPWVPLLLGAPAYAAIGTLFAVFFKRPMIAGAVFVIGWEELVGATPGQAGVRATTVVDSVRTLFYHGVPEAGEFREFQREWRGFGEELAMPPASDAVANLLWLIGLALLLALVLGARKDYDTAPKD